MLNIFIGTKDTKSFLIEVGNTEIRIVKNMKISKIKGISKKIVSKPRIIWIEINIPNHEFLELVSKMEVMNKIQIIAVILVFLIPEIATAIPEII